MTRWGLFDKAELDKIKGVRYLNPYSCRHTYVGQLQTFGVDMETIKSIVGRADLDMTRHYLHVREPIRQATVQKLNEAFRERQKQRDKKFHYFHYVSFYSKAIVVSVVVRHFRKNAYSLAVLKNLKNRKSFFKKKKPISLVIRSIWRR